MPRENTSVYAKNTLMSSDLILLIKISSRMKGIISAINII
jgi:hypothetical protein